MTIKQAEKRIAALEEQVRALRDWHHDHESNMHLAAISQRITNRLFELGAGKVDLRLIASLNTALGCDLLPLTGKDPKKAVRYATKGIKNKKP